ncbi:MAG TPA: YetF domain-containing protein [Bryobacteraceae bacterium]|nr:YetF domain-containing protein [Bryobacteraceae bacterium]
MPSIFTDMFTLQLPVLEKILRPVLVYLFLVLMLRIFGKRELAQLNPFDLVVILSLSNTVQNAIIGNDNSLTGGLIGAFALLAMNYLVIRFLFRHPAADRLIEGSPTTLIEQGKIIGKNLEKELLTEAELLTVANRQGFESIGEIESCTLEPSGIFFMKGHSETTETGRHEEIMTVLKDLRSKMDGVEQRLITLEKNG